MRAALWIVGLLIFLGCAGLGDGEQEPTISASPVPEIMSALDAQQITPGQAQQYLWAAFLGTEGQIPDVYQTSAADAEQTTAARGEAHALMSRVFDDWEAYSGEEQWGIALSISRLSTDLPPLKLIQRYSASTAQQQLNELFEYSDTHSISFCRYAEYGDENKKLGFYDEFTAELPDCSGLDAGPCGREQACEYSPMLQDENDNTIAVARCHRKRFWESCEPGWLDPANEDKRQALLHAAPTPYLIIRSELGWPDRRPEIARLALLHSLGSDPDSLPDGLTTQQYSSRSGAGIPFVILQPDPPRYADPCSQDDLKAVVIHELFHVAQLYHRRMANNSEEAMATWFEDFVDLGSDSEQSFIEDYPIAPGIPLNDRSYHGALALRTLSRAAGADALFDIMQSSSDEEESTVDLAAGIVQHLPPSELEALHTLSEQTYGMVINDLRNDNCDIKRSLQGSARLQESIEHTVNIGTTPGERIEYPVPELSYAYTRVSVDERVLMLNLNLQQHENTRTSLLVDAGGAAQERLIRLVPGMNRFCFEGRNGERDCACADVDDADLLPSHELVLVSTQLDNTEQNVNITVDVIKHTDKATCWRVASASLYYDSLHISETENGPIVYFLENPSGLPPDAPACTAIYMENHAGTVVDNLPSSPREAECTIHGKTSLPVEYRITSQSDASITGAYAPFGIHPLYMEDIEWECNLPNAQRYGMILQWQFNGLMTGQMPGIFRQIPGQYDPWDFPSYFEHTIQPGTDHMTLNRKRVSEDGIKIVWSVALEEVDQRECAFGEGLWQRSKDYHSEEYSGPR